MPIPKGFVHSDSVEVENWAEYGQVDRFNEKGGTEA